MAETTIGQEEDDAAFEELMGFYSHVEKTLRYLGESEAFHNAMRLAFDAGMKRGLEKHGCCEDERGSR